MAKLLPVLVLIMMSVPAFAQSTAPKPQQATEEKKNDLDRIVCERQETIGSRLAGRKVCMTVSQWQEQKRQYREQIEKFQQMGTQMGNSPGG
jgi:invasion protein IalB